MRRDADRKTRGRPSRTDETVRPDRGLSLNVPITAFRIAIIFSLGFEVGLVPAWAQTVDFRFAPPRWMTPINFVDDWQKSLVTQDGALAYDFGPGPYARPTTTIRVAIDSLELNHAQTLHSARVPIVETVSSAIDPDRLDTLSVLLEALAVPPSLVEANRRGPVSRPYRRLNGQTGSIAWAQPHENVDRVFRSVAWGTGRSIIYEIDVSPSAHKRIALGFAEAHREGRIKRELELFVEGDESRVVDLMEIGEQNQPHVFFFDATDLDDDGRLRVEVTASMGTQDPNTILNGIWVFAPERYLTEAEVISGQASRLAELVINCGWEMEYSATGPRVDMMRVSFDAPGAARTITVDTRRELKPGRHGIFWAEDRPFLKTTPTPLSFELDDGRLVLRYPVHVDTVEIATAHGLRDGDSFPATPSFDRVKERAVDDWVSLDLPWSSIQVPDQEIQNLLEASIRTVFQVRDIVDGFPQVQPGPSVYRGLWYGDATWATDGLTLIGDTAAAVASIEAMMAHQDSTGRAGVMVPPLLHRETAHLVYAMARYARLTQNDAWLRTNWPALAAAMHHLAALRRIGKSDPDAPYHGLFPPGLTDGGIGGINPEYGSSIWGLIAMAEAVRAAEWIGNQTALAGWKTEFEDFLASFKTAADRDMRRDRSGNLFLPVLMNFDPSKNVPQRGQWGMMHAYYAGKFLEDDDPLLLGTLDMLESHIVEGLVADVGWLDGGLWPIFDAHRALAYNRLGRSADAVRVLYAFANHASPTYVFVEEQMPQGEGTRVTGDIPHVIANVQAIRLVRYMLLLERDDRLEIFPSLPPSWLESDGVLRIVDAPTEFGPVSLTLEVSDGEASLSIDAPDIQTWINTESFESAGFRVVGQDSIGRPIRLEGRSSVIFSRFN